MFFEEDLRVWTISRICMDRGEVDYVEVAHEVSMENLILVFLETEPLWCGSPS